MLEVSKAGPDEKVKKPPAWSLGEFTGEVAHSDAGGNGNLFAVFGIEPPMNPGTSELAIQSEPSRLTSCTARPQIGHQ